MEAVELLARCLSEMERADPEVTIIGGRDKHKTPKLLIKHEMKALTVYFQPAVKPNVLFLERSWWELQIHINVSKFVWWLTVSKSAKLIVMRSSKYILELSLDMEEVREERHIGCITDPAVGLFCLIKLIQS